MASITELAKELNLSIGTVSRILNDDKSPYAAHTRQRVLARANELGYRPHPVARALARRRTDAIALWVGYLRSTYNSWVITSLTNQAPAQDYNLLIRLFENAPVAPGHSTAPILSDSVDGIITHGIPPESWLARVRHGAKPVPLVAIGDVVVEGIPDCVVLSAFRASREAVEHLVSQGMRRIAFMTIEGYVDQRYQAYAEVMREAGLAPEFIWAPPGLRALTRMAFREYVARHGHPEAVFCYNDDTAIAVYRALCDLELRVPDDVALVGCDGIEDTEFLPVPITTIARPVAEVSRLAWDYLKIRMADPDAPPQRTVVEATLEIRESSRR